MKLQVTRERLILGGVLGAAGLGLLLDQTLFAASTESSEPASLAVAKAPHVAPAATPERQLADRLTQLSGALSADADRNVFASGNSLGGPTASGSKVSSLEGRTLNGVLAGADGKGVAIIDGRLLPVGSRVGKLKLVRVSSTEAVFSDGVHETVFHLSEKKISSN